MTWQRRVFRTSFASSALGLVIGSGLLCLSYSVAATQKPGQLEFAIFWFGELVALVPLMLRLAGPSAARSERLALVTAAGLFAFVPKFLRDPTSPLYHDELGHWRQADAVFHAGHAFLPNALIHIITYFPGLELLTASLRNVTGLSTFQVGEMLLWLLHVIALIGVFVLIERLTRSARAGGLGALIYAANPSFMFFNSQFSYESLAIVFFIWALVCVVGAQTAAQTNGSRWRWALLGLVMACACVVTHHLSSYALVAALACLSLGAMWRRRRTLDARRRARLTWAFTLVSAAIAGAWVVLVAPGTIGYLSPYPSHAITEVLALLSHHSSPRQLFRGSSVPAYERVAAFLTPPLLAGLVGLSLWRMVRNHRSQRASVLGLAAFGLFYFASLPVMLTGESQGATRSWAFSYLGLSVILAPFAVVVLRRFDLTFFRRIAALAATLGVLVVMLVGNVSLDVNAAYRFPGPYVYDSDTRSLTPELQSAANWLREYVGPNQNVVTDRDTGVALGTFGQQNLATAWAGLPTWQLYFSSGLPSQHLLSALRGQGYRYLVVDTEMYHNLPEVGVYVEPDEPGAFARAHPPSLSALAKFASLPWLTEIFSTQHLRIYRFDFSQVDACPAVTNPTLSLLPGCRAKQ